MNLLQQAGRQAHTVQKKWRRNRERTKAAVESDFFAKYFSSLIDSKYDHNLCLSEPPVSV